VSEYPNGQAYAQVALQKLDFFFAILKLVKKL
jgi:hypothetical protein